jgi:hypothetical protein
MAEPFGQSRYFSDTQRLAFNLNVWPRRLVVQKTIAAGTYGNADKRDRKP